jgi:hypothetical protein
MPSLRVQIVRFVDEEPQPGIVESQFSDAHGKVHSIIDKVPMLTNKVLWSDSEYGGRKVESKPPFTKQRCSESFVPLTERGGFFAA